MIKKVSAIIRKLIFPLILFNVALFSSQSYLILDSLKQNFTVKEYTLNTKDIYSIDKSIDLFNVYLSKHNILLLSVLPNLQSADTSWSEIDITEFQDSVLSKNKLLDIATDWLENSKPENKTFQYKLIKKIDEKYYVSDVCLTELFNINTFKKPLISNYGSINIDENKVNIKEMKAKYEQEIKNEPFILDIRNQSRLKNIDNQFEKRMYHSTDFLINKEKAYQFWTFDGWWKHDDYNIHRGIDRFLYIPNKGIVGGSYDFYFSFKPKNTSNNYFTEDREKLWKNIIDEKIMIANELK